MYGPSRVLVIGSSLVLMILYSWFLTPNYDDGFNAYFIRNTIDFENSFYSEYFKMRFPVMKLPVIIIAMGFTYLFPTSFMLPAMLGAILSVVCSCLAYKIVRFYSDRSQALFCSILFLYGLVTHHWVSPTRFELWLLVAFLWIMYLSESYLRDQRLSKLVQIAFIVGVIGLPLHSNASMLYVFLILYIVFNKSLFSFRNIIIFGALTILFSGLGLLIVLIPDPAESVEFFKMMSIEGGQRSIPNIFNLGRFLYFLQHDYYKYLSVFFIMLGIVSLFINQQYSWDLLSSKVRIYQNILLFSASALISIEFLPAARWPVYFVYYLFPLSFLCTRIVFSSIISYRAALLMSCCIALFIIRFVLSKYSVGQLYSISTMLKISLLYIPILFSLYFLYRGKLHLIYLSLFLAFSLKNYHLYSDWLVYNEVREFFHEHPEEPIIATAEFNWIERLNSDFDLAPFSKEIQPDAINSGLVIWGSTERSRSYPVEFLLSRCKSCDYQPVDLIRSSFGRFVGEKFKNLVVYRYTGTDVITSSY